MNIQTPTRTHNNPPDPIDEVIAAHFDTLEEVPNWLDGSAIENEAQMKAVDALLAGVKAALKDLAAAEKSATAPLHDAWKAEIARFKPTKEDFERQKAGLIAVVDVFKRKLADEKKAAERAAWAAADAARVEAAKKAAAAASTDLDAQREADEEQRAALDAIKAAQATGKDTVKGMRTVHRFEITDHRAALHWIAAHDKPAMTAFIEAYVAKNHKTATIEGVRTYTEKEAF